MDNRMVKLKQQDYVELHRIVTGLNEKEIWRRAMKADTELGGFDRVMLPDAILDGIPDELHDWVRGVAWRLTNQVYLMKKEASGAYMQALPSQITGLDERGARRRYAFQIKEHPAWLQKTLWLMYDGKDPLEFLWKQVEPKGDVRK